MRSGVSTNSLADDGTFAVTTGAEDPGSYGYVIENLGDLFDLGEAARITPSAGTVVIERVLSAAAEIQCLALCDHTMTGAEDVRVEFFSDAAFSAPGTDTGAVGVPTPTADPQTFPVVLTAAETVRSIRITITGLTGDLEVGGLEIGGFWEVTINAGLEAGLEVGGAEQVLVGGGSYGAEGEVARTRSFHMAFMDLAASSTTGLDWAQDRGTTRPYVLVEDADNPASWPRDCFLAVNQQTPRITAVLADRDRVEFSAREVR